MQWSSQVALGGFYDQSRQDGHITQNMVDQVKMELHYAHHDYFINERHEQ
jgi:hypothetical protein